MLVSMLGFASAAGLLNEEVEVVTLADEVEERRLSGHM